MTNGTGDTFRCARCHKVFDKVWSDEEALAEAFYVFGPIPREELVEVCDGCWWELADRSMSM